MSQWAIYHVSLAIICMWSLFFARNNILLHIPYNMISSSLMQTSQWKTANFPQCNNTRGISQFQRLNGPIIEVIELQYD